MSEQQPLHRAGLVVPVPSEGMTVSTVRFRGSAGDDLELDLYRPSRAGTPAVVVLVSGYSDPGFARVTGTPFRKMVWTTSWARLFASAGLAAVTYAGVEPFEDLVSLLRVLRQRAGEWRLDASRIGLFASSGHVPTALGALMRDCPAGVRCAALLYGYMLDLAGTEHTLAASETFRFSHPAAGRTVDELQPGARLLVVRAGRDAMPGLNETIDAFVRAAVARNLDLTLVNHSDAPHAFDLVHDTPRSRSVIGEVVAFLREALQEDGGQR